MTIILLKILKLFIIIDVIFAIIRFACFIVGIIYCCLDGWKDKEVQDITSNQLSKFIVNGFFALILYTIYKLLPLLVQYLF